MRVSENIFMRRIFGYQKEQVMVDRRTYTLTNLYFYSSADIINVIKWRQMRCMGHVTQHMQDQKCIKDLIVTREGTRSLGKRSEFTG
jgi:hypothetical protein